MNLKLKNNLYNKTIIWNAMLKSLPLSWPMGVQFIPLYAKQNSLFLGALADVTEISMTLGFSHQAYIFIKTTTTFVLIGLS